MKVGKAGIYILIIAVSISSCQSGVIFEKSSTLPAEGWNQDNIISYLIPVEDTVNQYEISLLIRNEARYEYSNLFLFINTTAPSGLGIRDTVEIRMADESGKWYGTGIGGKYTLKIPFKTRVIFPQKGNYRIEIEQGMRDPELEFISDIGLIVTKL